MKKSIKKNLTIILGFVLCVCLVVASLFTNTNKSFAALRDSDIISESFAEEELSYKKWNLDTGSNEDSIKSYTMGNGVFQINSTDTSDMRGTYYFNKYVPVADDEDLIIEYTVDDFYIGSKNVSSSIMLVKGMGSASELPTSSIKDNGDALLEGIASFFESGRAYLATAYGLRSGITSLTESTSQVSVAYSSRSEFRKYCEDNIFNNYVENAGYNIAYGFDNVTVDDTNPNLVAPTVRSWCGEKFDNYILEDNPSEIHVLYSQEEIDDYAIYHIFEKGYTFKNVYLATGGYKCFVKPAGTDDSEYTLFASLSDYIPDTTCKRFIQRSGYIGFNVFGEDMSLSLDDFNVYTIKGNNQSTKTEQISLDFDLDSEGNRYGTTKNGLNDWKFTKTAIFSTKVVYDEMGYLFNNPDATAFLYAGSTTRIKYDGLYDDYAIIDFTVSIKELSKGKDFGLIIGGTSIDHLLNHNGNIYIYLRNNESEDNYSIGVDKIEQGSRVSFGTKKTAIIKSELNEFGDSYTVRISAKKDGTLSIIVLDNSNSQIGNTLTFGNSSNQIFLQNRIAVYVAENEYCDSQDKAIVLLKYLNVRNKYFNAFTGASNVTIDENFEGKDEDGEFKATNGVTVTQGSVGTNTTISNAGVFIQDGALYMRGVGYRSGVYSRYAYNSFDMYIDIVDMERTTPLGMGPLVFEFGAKTSGLSTGSNGSNLVVRSPVCVKDAQGNVIKRLNGDNANDASLSKAVPDTELKSTIAFSHSGVAEDFGVLRHNLLDPALEGYSIRFKVSYSPDGILSLAYYVIGLEDESMLNQPVYSKYFEGGEGYVGITSTHTLNTCYYANMVLDNFKVVDTDNVIEKETVIIEDDNFDYDDYLYDFVMTDNKVDDGNKDSESGCSSFVSVTYYGGALIILAMFMLIRKSRRIKNEKD